MLQGQFVASVMAVGAIICIPPDHAAPRRGKLGSLLPAALAFTWWRTRRQTRLRRPVFAGLVAGLLAWFALTGTLSLLQRCCRWCHRCRYRSLQVLWCSSHLNDLEALFVLLIQSLVKH